MINMYYDAHCHLNLLTEKEIKKALTDAKEKNVTEMISCSTSFKSNRQNLLLAKNFPQTKAAIGLYPLDLLELNDQELGKAFGFFENNIKNAIAIGEVGLDNKYCKTKEDKEKQENNFIRFIELSKKYDKPLIIHSRYAQRTVLELLASEKANKVLLHSFTDSKKLMDIAVTNEWFVGVGVNILFNEEVQKNIAGFPLKNLLFETDSPIRFNGEKAMPLDIVKIAEKVASLKEIAIDLVEAQQEENYTTLFC